MAARYGLGKSPIRAALPRLVQEGFVEKSSERGTFVAPLTLRAVRDTYQMRYLLEPAAAELAAQLGPIPERVQRYPLEDLRIGRTVQYQVGANWKAICENYNECYHCGPVHPELCAVVPAFREASGSHLDWAQEIPHRPGAHTFTTSGTTSRRPFPGLSADEQTRHKGEKVDTVAASPSD